MSYLVLARKYRPQTFDDVIAQAHVTQTLKNAILSNRIPHAILFSGPRGTGKTTIARVLAKAMNCKEGPTPAPCNTCRSCREITLGNAVDVFEIDGASNNSVDQVRELRENVKFMPAHSLYKIYIIDEVHMLSVSAFNALLKTLEEPPAHVMFLFATTEPHKIPLTILSRCQRHDLKRVDLRAIQGHLRAIANKETIEIDEESLETIAREADGCVRDALSLLDQIISCANGPVNHGDMVRMFGLFDQTVMMDLSQAILTGDTLALLDIIDQLHSRGQDIKKLYARLITHFRNLLVVKSGRSPESLPDIPDHERKMIQSQVQTTDLLFLGQVIDLLFREEPIIRFSDQPRLALEVILIKLLQIKPALSIDTLIEKLDGLKNDLMASAGNNRVPASRPKHPEIGSGQNRPLSPLPSGTESPGVPATPPAPAARPLPESPQEREAKPPEDEQTLRETPQESINVSLQNLLRIFEKEHPPIGACLKKSVLKKLTDQSMELEVSGSNFEINRVRNDKSMATIRKVFRNYFGRKIEVVIHGKPDDAKALDKKRERENELRKEAKSHPLVEEAIRTLNPKQVNIKIIEEKE